MLGSTLRSVALRRMLERGDPGVLGQVRGRVRITDEPAGQPLQEARVREQLLR